MKKRLLIYSDCYTFSGSENVVLNILSSDTLQEEYDIHFIYRFSEKYERKLKQVMPQHRLHATEAIYLKRFSDLFYDSGHPEVLKKIFFKLDLFFDSFLVYFIVWIPIFIRKIRKLQPDLVHINNGGYPGATSCLAFAIASRFCKTKKIIMHVNNLACKRKWYDIPYFFLDRYLQDIISSYVTGSKAAGLCLQENRVIAKNKIVNINNTLLKDQLAITNNSFIKKPTQEIWIGFVGLLTKRKGLASLIEAACVLKDDLQEKKAKFIIVGDGEDERKLKQLVANRGLDKLIIFTGSTNEVYKYLYQFDVFVLPSLSNEDFPYVLLEAMVYRKPVISTRVAGIPEIVLNNHTGYIIAPGNVSELSEKINALISDPDKRMEMGKKGYNRYHSLFSYEKTMEKFKGLYMLTS